MVMVVGWVSILAGVLVALLGAAWVAALFSGGGAPVGGVGIYVFLTMIAGPLLVLGGIGAIVCAVKLMGGVSWTRSALEIFWWTILVTSTGYLVYRALTDRYILAETIIIGVLYFLATGASSIVMLILLRSGALRRALIH